MGCIPLGLVHPLYQTFVGKRGAAGGDDLIGDKPATVDLDLIVKDKIINPLTSRSLKLEKVAPRGLSLLPIAVKTKALSPGPGPVCLHEGFHASMLFEIDEKI